MKQDDSKAKIYAVAITEDQLILTYEHKYVKWHRRYDMRNLPWIVTAMIRWREKKDAEDSYL